EKTIPRCEQKRRPDVAVVCVIRVDSHEFRRRLPTRKRIRVRNRCNKLSENRRTIRDLRKRGQLDGPETPSHSKARGQPCDHSLDNCGLSTARSYPFSLASYSYSKLRDKCKINVRRREARKAVLPPAVRPAPLAGAGF